MSIRSLPSAVFVAVLLGTAACSSAPPYAGMTPEEMFALGEERYEAGEWRDAVEVLDRLVIMGAAASLEFLAEARFMLARAYFEDEKYITSVDEYTRFLTRFPTHSLAARASLGICESFANLSAIPQRDQVDTRQAAFACGNVAQDYAGIDAEVAQEAGRLSAEMRNRMAESDWLVAEHYYRRQYYDSAMIFYEFVVNDYPDTIWAPRAIVGLICAYRKVEYEEDVTEWTRRLLESYAESPEAASVSSSVPEC